MEQQAGCKLSYDTPQTYAQTLMQSIVPHSEERLLPAATVDTATTRQTLQQQQQEWEVYDASRYGISGVSTDNVAHSVAELSQRSEQQLIREWTHIAPAKKQQQTTALNTDTATAATATAKTTAGSSIDTSGSYWHSVDSSVGSVHGQMRDIGNTVVAPQMRPPQYCSVKNPYAVFTSSNSSSCDSGSSSSSD
jgi:hypothetical protein